MTTYAYKCPTHGVWEMECAMSEHASVMQCPRCDEWCPQEIAAPPAANGIWEGRYESRQCRDRPIKFYPGLSKGRK